MKRCKIPVLLTAILLSSCEYGQQAEDQMNKFNSRVHELDSLVNDGIEKVNDLELILPETGRKLKEADSIIQNAATTLDSLNQKVNDIKNIFN